MKQFLEKWQRPAGHTAPAAPAYSGLVGCAAGSDPVPARFSAGLLGEGDDQCNM